MAGAQIKRESSVLDPRLVRAMLGRLDEKELGEALRGLELLARASAEQMESRSPRNLVRRRQFPE